MTSFIAAGGSGRSISFIPAVPAASSVTTIAFIRGLPVSSPRLHGIFGSGALAAPDLDGFTTQIGWHCGALLLARQTSRDRAASVGRSLKIYPPLMAAPRDAAHSAPIITPLGIVEPRTGGTLRR